MSFNERINAIKMLSFAMMNDSSNTKEVEAELTKANLNLSPSDLRSFTQSLHRFRKIGKYIILYVYLKTLSISKLLFYNKNS